MTMLKKTIAAAALALSLGGMAGMSDPASAMPINGVTGAAAAPFAVEPVQYYGGYGYRRRFFRPYGYGFYGPRYGRGFYGRGYYGRGFGYGGYRY